MTLTVIQTSDCERYARMLDTTSLTVGRYCTRHGYRQEQFRGIKRGHWPWQATFNRLYMLWDLVSRGADDWVLYMDADSYIYDLTFDLQSYLHEKQKYAAIFVHSGATQNWWDVNAGVFFMNLSDRISHRLIRQWINAYEYELPDEKLRISETWVGDADQGMLQRMLRDGEDSIKANVLIEAPRLFNNPNGEFIRQQMRDHEQDLEKRIAIIASEVNAVLARD